METQLVIEFISCLNRSLKKDVTNQATKILSRLTNKSYSEILSNHLNLLINCRQKMITLKHIQQEISSYKDTIRQLETKTAQLKKYKAQKSKQFEDYVLKKYQMMEFLQAGSLERVIDLSKKHNAPKIKHIASQMLEYRWFKMHIDSMRKQQASLLPKGKEPEWSQTGRQMKTMLMNNKNYFQEFNNSLNQNLINIISKQKPFLNLHQNFFATRTMESLERINIYIESLKEVNRIDQKYNMQMIMKAEQRLGIEVKSSSQEEFASKFEKFIKHIETLLPQFNSQSSFSLSRTHSQKHQKQQSSDIFKLYDQMKRLFKMSDISTEDFIIGYNLSYKDCILSCLKNLVLKVKGQEEAIQANKEILAQYMSESTNTLSKLIKINLLMQKKFPSLESLQLSKKSFEQNLATFQRNLNGVLNEFDKTLPQRYHFSQSHQSQSSDQERKFDIVNLPPSQNIIIEPIVLQETNLESERIQDLRNEISKLKQMNDELIKTNNHLKETFEEECRINDIHKKQRQSLVSRIKTLEGVQSFIINTPFIDEDTNIAELREKFGEISAENEQLRKYLEEKQLQIKQCELSKTEIIKKSDQCKDQEIKKWKLRFDKAEQQIKDLYDQQLRLNEMLEEKLFGRLSNSKSIIAIKNNPTVIMVEAVETARKTVDVRSIQTESLNTGLQQAQSVIETEEKPQANVQEINSYKSKIIELEGIISKLQQLNIQKQKEYLQARLKDKKMFDDICSDLKQQKVSLQSHIATLSIQAITHSAENIKTLHLFTLGSIFNENDYQQRLFLIQNLVNCVGPISKTRLLYRADNYNKVNFHKYIDNQKHIVLILKTLYGKLIAGYSEEAFDSNGTKRGYGMILSLWAKKMFPIREKKAICYDDYFVIFGNSELRIKSLEFKLFSNFGIANGYYDTRGEKVHSILGQEKEREVDVVQYEFYALDLDQ